MTFSSIRTEQRRQPWRQNPRSGARCAESSFQFPRIFWPALSQQWAKPEQQNVPPHAYERHGPSHLFIVQGRVGRISNLGGFYHRARRLSSFFNYIKHLTAALVKDSRANLRLLERFCSRLRFKMRSRTGVPPLHPSGRIGPSERNRFRIRLSDVPLGAHTLRGRSGTG